MCGIAGVLDRDGQDSPDRLAERAAAMAATLRHRGPDDDGVWVDAAAGVALGHRRLAVIDLSPEGHQPMLSASGRFVLDFNGEIYNHAELRRELEARGGRFRGHSDTEVLVEAVDAWGLTPTLRRCNGMFALALWDRHRRVLTLVRDRLGEKPLYWSQTGRGLIFGSELKALEASPGFAGEIDRDALALYLRLGYLPAPHTIYREVQKLAAGHLVSATAHRAEVRRWWDAGAVIGDAVAGRHPVADREAVDRFEDLLASAVSLRLGADVPLGAFLSGGIDSTLIVALMQQAAAQPVRTFTVGFGEASHDEAVDARTVAEHLGTDHTEIHLSPGDALEIVPKLPEIWDEPFADPSQIPTALIARAARGHVTVALSGDGGDEVFAGYNRYVLSRWARGRLGWVPRPARAAAGRAITAVAPDAWDRTLARLGPVLPRALRVRNPGDKAHKLALLLAANDPSELHRALVSSWADPGALVPGAHEPAIAEDLPRLADETEQMVLLDTVTTLPDEMLAKVDRASMAVGLEMRVPLLDHRIVQAAWSLPLDLRLRGGQGKWLLRQILLRHVPAQLIDRPKMGFDPPLAAWLRGPLRAWAEGLLDPAVLGASGYLDPAPIRSRWQEHLSGRRNWDYALWAVLMFEAWRGRPSTRPSS